MTELPATPEEFPRAFAAAWMARDAVALAALFAADADFVNVAGLWWEDRRRSGRRMTGPSPRTSPKPGW